MKKIKYIFLILLFTICINVNATEENINIIVDDINKTIKDDLLISNIETFERNEDNHYGVNKKWNINESNLDNVLNTKYVDASLKVYDFANILTDEEETELREKINEYIEKTNMDVVILTIDEEYHSDYRNEQIAADFYDYNDFGVNFDNYSGTLLLRNTYSLDPYFDIYTFGEAQRYYDYDRLQYILDDIYYDLHAHYYLQGFNLFINHLNNYYNSGIPKSMINSYVDDMGYIKRLFVPSYITYGIIGLIVSLIIVSIYISKNKMVKLEKYADEYLDRTSINMEVKKDTLVSSHTTHYRVSSSSSSGGGYSGGSHSGSSGGGHSSGGGRHG